MATTRIGGDFDSDAVEAFRSAYALQMQTVENLDQDERMGLPADTISNTAPWYAHVGIWKYPSGKGPEDDLKAPFNPQDHYTVEEEEDERDELTEEEIKEYLMNLSEDEFEEFGREYGFVDEEEDQTMTDTEIDALIEQLLNEETDE